MLLGGGFKYFFTFHRYFGEMIQFDEHIFQMGWFNHQLEMLVENNLAADFWVLRLSRQNLQYFKLIDSVV